MAKTTTERGAGGRASAFGVLTQDGAKDISCILGLRSKLDRFEVNKPKEGVHRDLEAGWLMEHVLCFDQMTWGRWAYWMEAMDHGQLPAGLLPQIEWESTPHAQTRKMMEKTLDCIPRYGEWRTMGSWEYFRYFVQWALFGFGHRGQPEPPKEPPGCEGASDRLYQVFNPCALMLWPHDYLGDLMADNAYGRRQGFFPTPLHLCELMAQMVFGELLEETRVLSFMDPCCGTGRFPLVASNYTTVLYGMDIDATLVQATLFNGYLYAPWLVRPFPFVDPRLSDPSESGRVADTMAASAPPQAQAYLAGTEHDSENQWRFEPIKKRRRKTSPDSPTGEEFRQGHLF